MINNAGGSMSGNENDKLNVKCFDVYNSYGVPCDEERCRQWVNSEEFNNCTINVANDGPKTQEEIAKIFNLTRMRVCQIEQKAKNKMKKRIGEEWRN